jgi:hypothetical protein
MLGQQGRRKVGALDLEPSLAGGRGAGAKIVQHTAQEQGFAVVIVAGAQPVVRGAQLAEQVAAHTVVEHCRRLGGLG